MSCDKQNHQCRPIEGVLSQWNEEMKELVGQQRPVLFEKKDVKVKNSQLKHDSSKLGKPKSKSTRKLDKNTEEWRKKKEVDALWSVARSPPRPSSS